MPVQGPEAEWTGPDLEPAPTQETSILELAERPPIPALAITPEQVQRQLPPSTGPWAVEQSLWLGAEGSADHLVGKVQILDRDTIISASSAVEGLNRGTFKCTDDFCVVFSASSRGYYLLYRQGLREQALDIASLPPVEEAVAPTFSGDSQIVVQVPSTSSPPPEQDIARAIVAAADANDAEQADELLRQAVGQRTPLPEVCYDAVIAAFDRSGNSAKSEEWLWRALQSGLVPREESFVSVINAGCRQGATLKVEDTMAQMMSLRIRPPREVFDKVIGIFAKQRNPMKVEEWLLNAGQSGWTPQQAAFDAVVKLYAEVDAMKAEEWLRRSQETEYRLPDTCYVPVVLGFVRAGNPDKAEDVLAMMKANGYMADEAALQEVINLHAEGGNASRAEHLLEIFGSSSGNLDDLRLGIIDASLRAGDVDVAERQVLSLQDPEAGRTMEVAKLLAARGETPRAKTVLEQQCRAAGGDVPPEVCALLLSVAAALSDAPSVEAAAQMLLQTGPLSELQVATLRDAVGDQRAEVVLRDAAAAAIPAMTAPSKGPINGRSSRKVPAQWSMILSKNQAKTPSGSVSPPSKAGSPKAAPKRGSGSLSNASRGRAPFSSR